MLKAFVFIALATVFLWNSAASAEAKTFTYPGVTANIDDRIPVADQRLAHTVFEGFMIFACPSLPRYGEMFRVIDVTVNASPIAPYRARMLGWHWEIHISMADRTGDRVDYDIGAGRHPRCGDAKACRCHAVRHEARKSPEAVPRQGRERPALPGWVLQAD